MNDVNIGEWNFVRSNCKFMTFLSRVIW